MSATPAPTANALAGVPLAAASLVPGPAGTWQLVGAWTLEGLGRSEPAHPLLPEGGDAMPVQVLDGSRLQAIDSAGAWTLQRWLRARSAAPALQAWPERARSLMEQVQAGSAHPPAQPVRSGRLVGVGRWAVGGLQQAQAFAAFVGQVAVAGGQWARHPGRIPRATLLREIEIGGFDALPIIGLTSFLLGVVVAYQGADQLKHYGANVFVVELVGYAMLREFAPLIGAIIIAGRSGSAYAAQIGTMVVAEEVDAMRTLGIDPTQRLVLPKVVALAFALPLLTVFADVAGVFGGMVMARSQLGIGFVEFAARFGSVMQGSALLIGVGKAFVFAFIIVTVGCFQGFRTRGSSDSVGRQTTQSVVQSIFLVIVADALFSVAFNLLGL
jgi:phospholipid/cholesterol/gamma-HCH transport system permease protein